MVQPLPPKPKEKIPVHATSRSDWIARDRSRPYKAARTIDPGRKIIEENRVDKAYKSCQEALNSSPCLSELQGKAR